MLGRRARSRRISRNFSIHPQCTAVLCNEMDATKGCYTRSSSSSSMANQRNANRIRHPFYTFCLGPGFTSSSAAAAPMHCCHSPRVALQNGRRFIGRCLHCNCNIGAVAYCCTQPAESATRPLLLLHAGSGAIIIAV